MQSTLHRNAKHPGYAVPARIHTPLVLSVMPHGIYVGLKKSL
jgi:hypothetical protein